MRIGIYFTAGKRNGGVYQYSLGFLEALAKSKSNTNVIITTSPDIPKEYLQDPRFEVINLAGDSQAKFESRRTYLANVLGRYLGMVMTGLYRAKLFGLVNFAMRLSQRHVLAAVKQAQLDLLIFPAGSDLSYLVEIPTLVAVHDLQHRLNPQYKEVSYGGRWEYRENYYGQTCRKSRLILVDSEVGKEDILNCYPETDAAKIVVLPFLPPPYLEPDIPARFIKQTLNKYHINKPYIYYPAHFWSHKNHLVLVQALSYLHARKLKITLVLTGSKDVDFSTYDEIMAYAKSKKIGKYVKFLGYVESREVSALYKGAIALTMPTAFGPTNIPVLEAWSVGTPVIYSDIRGCREQLGDAGILADPEDPEAWAAAITSLIQDQKLVEKLVRKGKQRVAQWTMADFAARVEAMIRNLPVLK